MTKSDFFDLLNTGQLTKFPETELELAWFDEWVQTTPLGKQHKKKSDQAVDKMYINGFFQLFLFKSFLREQIDSGVTDFRIKVVNDREIEVIPSTLTKPYKNKYNSHFIKL